MRLNRVVASRRIRLVMTKTSEFKASLRFVLCDFASLREFHLQNIRNEFDRRNDLTQRRKVAKNCRRTVVDYCVALVSGCTRFDRTRMTCKMLGVQPGTSPMNLTSAENSARNDTSHRPVRRPGLMISAVLRVRLLGLAVAMLSPAMAFAQFLPSEPGITVEGSGEVRSVPDVVEINLKLAATGRVDGRRGRQASRRSRKRAAWKHLPAA